MNLFDIVMIYVVAGVVCLYFFASISKINELIKRNNVLTIKLNSYKEMLNVRDEYYTAVNEATSDEIENLKNKIAEMQKDVNKAYTTAVDANNKSALVHTEYIKRKEA